MGEILAVVMNLSVLVFVIPSVLATGLSLTEKRVIHQMWQMPALVKLA